MDFKGALGGLYRISEWIMRMSVTNVLWLVCTSPVFFLLFLMNWTDTYDKILAVFMMIVLISPVTLFPGSAALFTVVRKWILGETDAPLVKTFFNGYRNNFKQSFLGGLFYGVAVVLLYINFQFYGEQPGYGIWLKAIFAGIYILLIVSGLYFISLMVHLHMKFWQLIKSSFYLGIAHPFRSLLLVAMNGTIVWISFTKITFLIPFFMGSIVAMTTYWNFHLIFQKVSEKQQNQELPQESSS